MRLDAKYQMAGRILLIPLSGTGNMFLEMGKCGYIFCQECIWIKLVTEYFSPENLDILLRTKTLLYEKGGFTFNNVTSVRVELNMTRVRSHFDNLFNGRSKEVERSTNQFFNDNWRESYEALKPLILDTVENIFFDIMSKVFHLIPANFFIEDIPTPQQLYGKVGDKS